VSDPETEDGNDLVRAERHDAVMLLTLNRPDRLNAWTDALQQRYFALLDEAEADPDVRAVVLTGAGRGFCAGADMDELHDVGATSGSSYVKGSAPRHRPLVLRKPLIGAINGPAAGLGFVEALYCDIRFSTPTAKFTTAFSRRGLIAEYGVAWILPRLVGPSRALDLLLSSRVVTGVEAHAMGLVDRLVEPEELVLAAIDYAQDLATHCSPASMSAIKTQVLDALDSTFLEAVSDADRRMHESFLSPDIREGVASYLERRAPVFPGLDAR
jgi:enoyl-CoA hydratase/carnithine racemase